VSAAGVTPETAQLGLIGLGVMGENLALNIDDHGYRVALWTHTEGKVQRFIDTGGAGRPWVGTRTLEDLAAALSPPRRILLMVKAGEPVDELLDRLAPSLAPGDVVIDGGGLRLSTVLAGPAVSEGQRLILHPVAFAGWLVLLFTALNLLPIGQLDDVAPVSRGRLALGALAFALVVLILSPVPHTLYGPLGIHCPYV